MKSPMRMLMSGRVRDKLILLILAAVAIFILLTLLRPSQLNSLKLKSLPGKKQSDTSLLLQKIHDENQRHDGLNKAPTITNKLASEPTLAKTKTSTGADKAGSGYPDADPNHKGKYGDVRRFSRSKDPKARRKQEKVKEMMKHAWDGYKKCAWGFNEVMPVTCHGAGGTFPGMKVGATIVDALSTLYIMNMMEEFDAGRQWVEESLSQGMNVGMSVSVFEFNIRHLGGLLSAYALSGEEVFLAKATEVGNKLLPAFNTTTGIPDSSVNLRTGRHQRVNWASGAILSEFGSLHLEFTYLSQLTRNPIYAQKVQNIRTFLMKKEKRNDLYPNFLDPNSGEWGSYSVSVGAFGDSFYEYLIKSYLQSNRKDKMALNMYITTMRAIKHQMIRKSGGGLTYLGNLKGAGGLDNRMEHLTCFAGGMFALSAAEMPDSKDERDFMEIGSELTTSCHLSYNKTKTGLGPESFRFENGYEATASARDAHHYLLRPEVVESYFVLWRLTHNQKYRDWGWQVVQALETHSRAKYGYSGITNVNHEDSQRDNVQQSFFLAETLKYLYLLFSDDELIPLNKWVFNTEAHPLPILSSR